MTTQPYSIETACELCKNKRGKDNIELLCPQCEKVFTRTKKYIQQSAWSKNKNIFCSKECQRKNLHTSIKTNCANPECNKEIIRILSSFKSGENVFCSRSCAAIINNAKYPKRLLEGTCRACLVAIPKKHTFCDKCFAQSKISSEAPIEELFVNSKSASKYSNIRYHARRIYLLNFMPSCVACGYSKHIDVAHIIPCSDFGPQTPLGVVNAFSNLLGLCKNCHWELDHGLLSSNGLKPCTRF
jgi:uncharacterized C2H2 Zn-finger protein